MLSVFSGIAPASWRFVCPSCGGPLAAAAPSARRGRPGRVRRAGGNDALHICAAGRGWQWPRHEAGSLAAKHLPSTQLRVFGNGPAPR